MNRFAHQSCPSVERAEAQTEALTGERRRATLRLDWLLQVCLSCHPRVCFDIF